jgi:hypothetical protein
MTQKTFKKKFSVKVSKRKKDKEFEGVESFQLEVKEVATGEIGTYYWNGSHLITDNSNLDMNYLDYLMSRGMGGGPDFVDIVEEYVMNELI